MVAPERQRQGLGDVLFRTWDRNVGASLGLGLSDSSYRLFQKMRWPDVGPGALPRQAAEPPRAAAADWPVAVNRFVSYVTLPWVRLVARPRPLQGEVRVIRHFDERLHAPLGTRARRSSRFAVRRDAAYLNWKYIQAPHVRYTIAVARARRRSRRLRRLSAHAGAARPRHAARRLPDRSRRRSGLSRRCCAGSIARRAPPTPTRSARSRCTKASASSCSKSGYYAVKSTMEFVARSTPCRCRPSSTRDTTAGTSRSAIPIRIDDSGRRTRPALLVAIDTEGDNQWDAERAAPPDVREHPRARPAARLLRAPRRPAHLRRSRYPVAHDPQSAEVLRGAARARRLRDRRAPSRVGNAAVRRADDVDRHPYALSLPLEQFDAQLASLTDAIADAVGVRPVSYRSGRFGFSAAHVSSLERPGYLVDSSVAPLFYEAHKRGPDFVGAPLTPVLPRLRRRDAAGSSQRARAADLGGAQPPRAGMRRALVRRARRGPTRRKRVLRLARHRARALAAAVVQLGRRHDRAGAADRRPRRADSQPALSLERGHRRRQSVQPDAGRTGRVLRSARPLPDVRDAGARRRADDVRRVPRRASARRSAACRSAASQPRRSIAADAHLPRLAAPAARSGGQRAAAGRTRRAGRGTRGDEVTFVAACAGAGPARPATLRWAASRGCRRERAAAAGPRAVALDTLAQARSHRARSTRRPRRATSCTCTATGSSSKSRRCGRGVGGSRTSSRSTAPRSGTTADAGRSIRSRARIAAPRAVTFYSQGLLDARASSGSTARDCRWSIPPCADVRAARRGDARRRCARRSASAAAP